MDKERVGRRIKAFRKLKGYTQVDFARELSIPLSVLGGVERGTREPNDDLILKVADSLNIEVDEIIISKDD
ncbi:helix-turn-helix domain-containing protein [Ornithinibacillus sp. L9]|uniref:Helix-turn-helix domain-containing protein n=1 Tax=Ornithinibacillus caprae TaxID=2678566 RepID=A0A6N8FH72_9BACI|nr:helix-turn-helix transcriptional regulator [Ornithinibacillus caprae]MUK88046.1 helix-turn-helix domain-containing protein [Ornithinibacillus caprae]